MLKDLIKGITTWIELEAKIISLPTPQDRGEVFEEFCQAFFTLKSKYQFKSVYRLNEVPASILKRIGHPDKKDMGIDGVAISNDDQITVYQAKFRSDRSNTPTFRELSTFFGISDHPCWRITITNANNLPKIIDNRLRQNRILSDSFDDLKPDFFNRLRTWFTEKIIVPPERRTPHETQKEAIDAALNHFKVNTRGQMILPCGTGKTLTAMWIAEQLGGGRILIMVPSLALLSQTLKEWAENTSFKDFHYLCLCSDTTVDLGNDAPVEHLYEMDVPVTTNVDDVSSFLNKPTDATSILLSTYQSSRVLSESVLKSKISFDLAIFDEAHRTTGTNASIWGLTLDDENVPVKKRLFMTATPKIYAPHITQKAKDEDVPICSMEDHAVYGEPVYKMTFGQAIERDLITDYKVVVICITDAEVKELVQKGSNIITTDNQEWDAKAFAKRLALAKALDTYNFKKIFTFHGKVAGAKAFTDTETQYSIKQVIEMLDTKPDKQNDIKYFHVNGNMSSGSRKSYLNEFKEAQIGIMSNARCLTEGVDIPSVDAIAFIDPKKSLIDIVQATGRAMRKAEGKEKGYIFVPVVVGEHDDPEEVLARSDFKTVWQILQAMVEQDQHLKDKVSELRVLQGKGEKDSEEWNSAMAEYSEKFEFFNVPNKIDITSFTETLYTKAIEVIAKSWDFWYGLTLKYKEEFGDANAPDKYKAVDGFNLGIWQGHQKKNYKKGELTGERIKKLEDIGFVWDVLEEAWENGYRETLKYKQQYGDANALARYKTLDGFELGGWQSNQRSRYIKCKLTKERIKKLEDIGFVWDLLEETWELGYQESLNYKEQYCNVNVSARYKTPSGFRLGNWQNNQRGNYKKNELDNGKIERLEDLGFVWDVLEDAWNKGYQETLKYKEQFGNANAPKMYKTPDGFRLGIWQFYQMSNYRKGDLDKERIKKLEEIGFIWDVSEESWKRGYQETIKYKQEFGDANAPLRHKTPDGFGLGGWQSKQKANYKNGKIEKKRIEKLKYLGFTWDQLEEAWETGYQETLKYKQQFGNANASQSYKAPDGFNLAVWQHNQMARYNKGELDKERIKRLNEVGFSWNLLDEAWKKGYQETVKYKGEYSNANVPHRYKTLDGFNLGVWQGTQKSAYKKGNLDSDKIKLLEDLGLVWDVSEDAWENGYQETVKYKEEFGKANASGKYKTPDGFNLGSWQSEQKKSYKKGKLDDERIKKLTDIGFVWERQKDS